MMGINNYMMREKIILFGIFMTVFLSCTINEKTSVLNPNYVQTVCGYSIAALMTGCYPLRNARPLGVEPYHSPNELITAIKNK